MSAKLSIYQRDLAFMLDPVFYAKICSIQCHCRSNPRQILLHRITEQSKVLRRIDRYPRRDASCSREIVRNL